MLFNLLPRAFSLLHTFRTKASRRELDPSLFNSLYQLLVKTDGIDFFPPRFQCFYSGQLIFWTRSCFDSNFNPLQNFDKWPQLSRHLITAAPKVKLLGNCAFGLTACSCCPTSTPFQYSWDRTQHAWDAECKVITDRKQMDGCTRFHKGPHE